MTLQEFIDAAQAMIGREFAALYPNVTPPRLEIMPGPRFTRIISNDGVSRSAWAFIENATGAILKPDGWKRPAKHARGNLHDPDPLRCIGRTGPTYLR
jgi:hypothetical protein